MFFKPLYKEGDQRMKRIIMFLLPILITTACSGSRKGTGESSLTGDSHTTESEFDTLATAEEDEWPVEMETEEPPLPKTVDELFDDFIFEFAQNDRFQQERIHFPLPVTDLHGDTSFIKKEEWEQEYLFLRQDYYTVLFNNTMQMELEKSTAREHVTVEWLHLTDEYSKNYDFKREQGVWRLTGIHTEPFDESPLSDFLRFYRRFSTDSIFQSEHIANPLRFATEDPDDDMRTLEGTLDASQWPDFKPELPTGILTNVRYGQTYRDRHKMVLLHRGISNGLMDILTFEKAGGQWKLAAYEN